MLLTPEQLKQLQDAIVKALGTKVTAEVEAKINQIVEEKLGTKSDFNSTLEDIKTEVKKLKENMNQKAFNWVSEEEKKGIIVKTFIETNKLKNVSESQFEQILENEIKKIDALNTIDTGAGKELVFDQFQKDIIKVMNEFEIIKHLNFITLKSWDRITLPKVTNGITTAYVEQGAKGNLSQPKFENITINVKKTFSAVNITEEMQDNMTSVDIYNLIVEMIGESQAEFLENEVLNGDWSNITWISNLTKAKIVRLSESSASSIDDDTIIDTQTALKSKYKKNWKVGYIMNEYILWILRKLRTADGSRLYPDLRGASPSIDNYPVIISDFAGEIKEKSEDGADKVVMMFWNLKYFQMVRRRELGAERGYINDNFLKGIETIKANQRFGGAATIEEAFVVVKTKA